MNVLPPCLNSIKSEAPAAVRCEACPAPWMHCSVRKFQKGQYPFSQGDAQGYVYRVQSGGLTLFLSLANGRRQVVDFAFPGDLVGLGSHRQFQFTAQAITRTELRCIPRDELRLQSLKDARIASMLYETAAFQLEEAYDHILTAGQRGSEGKLAAFLLAMSRRNVHHGDDPAVVHLPMLRTDIADYLGLTAETVSRTFTNFKAQGLIKIVDQRHVRLIEPRSLVRLANAIAASG